MRILFTTHGYKPAYRLGGPIISVSAVAERFVRRGHEVIVFTSNSNLDEDLDVPLNWPTDVEGVEVWYFARDEFIRRWFGFFPYLSKSSGFVYAPQMAAALEGIAPTVDVIHTHIPFIYPTFAAARAARRFRKPLFYHQRGVFDPQRLKFRSFKKSLYIKIIERPIMRGATTLIALTDEEVSSYHALGVNTPCHIVPNGVDISNYRQRANGFAARTLRLSAEALVVLFLGRIHPIKGADRLLQAFLEIQEQVPQAVLVLAGPDEFDLERKFKAVARGSSAEGGIRFPGMISGELKLDLLARADLFCLPSAGEGFSIAVLEALASGTPVLLSPGCHFPQVETAGAGRITEAMPEALATALLALLKEPHSLRRMGESGRTFVEQNYSWDTISDQLLDAYAEGIARNQIA